MRGPLSGSGRAFARVRTHRRLARGQFCHRGARGADPCRARRTNPSVQSWPARWRGHRGPIVVSISCYRPSPVSVESKGRVSSFAQQLGMEAVKAADGTVSFEQLTDRADYPT